MSINFHFALQVETIKFVVGKNRTSEGRKEEEKVLKLRLKENQFLYESSSSFIEPNPIKRWFGTCRNRIAKRNREDLL